MERLHCRSCLWWGWVAASPLRRRQANTGRGLGAILAEHIEKAPREGRFFCSGRLDAIRQKSFDCPGVRPIALPLSWTKERSMRSADAAQGKPGPSLPHSGEYPPAQWPVRPAAGHRPQGRSAPNMERIHLPALLAKAPGPALPVRQGFFAASRRQSPLHALQAASRRHTPPKPLPT